MSISTLIKKERAAQGLSQKQMADRLQVTQQAYSYYETGRSKPNADFYVKWKEEFKWDLYNTANKAEEAGASLKKPAAKAAGAKKGGQSSEEWKGVPMYDIPVYGGLPTLIRDEPGQAPIFYLPIPGYQDCIFGTRVKGDSMSPKIDAGDFVVCKEVDSFIFGDIYLVVTEDGQETIKYVHPNEQKDWVNLVPHNTEVPITPIHKKKIKKIYKVKGVVKSY